MSDKMSIDQILEFLYNKAIEPSEAKELLSNLVDDELSDDGCKCIRFTGSDKQFYCNCSRAKGLDHDVDDMPYCIECQKLVQ